MRRKVLTVYGIVLFSLTFGIWLGTQEGTLIHPIRAQTPSTYLSSLPIPSTLKITQVWMREPFCIHAWWYDDHSNLVRLCSEDKGTDTPSPGASFKVDLPGPAWLALEGRDAQGRWTLSSVPFDRPVTPPVTPMPPGANFVLVSGPTLVIVLSQVTPSPTMPPPASVTSSPPSGATAAPTARVTPTPPSPPGGGIPTLSPAQHAAFTVRCDFSGDEFTMTIWGSYGLVYSVPGEWCSEVDRGAQSLLERMAQATPSRVEVRP